MDIVRYMILRYWIIPGIIIIGIIIFISILYGIDKIKNKRKAIKNKKYKYKIHFKNGTMLEGTCEFPNLDTVYEVFLLNKFNQVNNYKKRILLQCKRNIML